MTTSVPPGSAAITPASVVDSDSIRRDLAEALRLDLIGPDSSDSDLVMEVLPQPPSRWYLTGFLVPVGAAESQRAPDAGEVMDEGGDPGIGDDGATPEPPSARRPILPSSIGLSVLVAHESAAVEVVVTWGDYHRDEIEDPPGRKRTVWRRAQRHEAVLIDLVASGTNGLIRRDVPNSGGLELVRLARPTEIRTETGKRAVKAVSLFLVNRRLPLDDDEADEAFAFQVGLAASVDHPFVARHDLGGYDVEDWDGRLADLQYRDSAEFAVGHNASVEAEVEGGTCRRVRTVAMPLAAVERVEPSRIDGVVFEMERLGALADGKEATAALSGLVEQYRGWITDQESTLSALAPRRRDVGIELIRRARIAADRIKEGISLLDDPLFLGAFRIANRAMAAAARRREATARKVKPQDLDAPAWRPFQIAFILLNLRSIAQPAHADRESVDLLFFPTGGGKTEAYLGLAAFTIVLRRLRDPGRASGGVAVLMRYTLRLLTLDQLGRAAGLMCALELEREKNKAGLGEWPFEIGLWVGRAATPNRMGKKGDNDRNTARLRVLHYANDGRRDPPLPIEQCPWCGEPFTRNSFQLLPHTDVPTDLKLICVNRQCDFGLGRSLPILGVDEPIYRRLPSFMIATVDKFAAMPWTGEVGGFFGGADRCDDKGYYGPMAPGAGTKMEAPLAPPDLIIQDELHLISGPLGTIAGLYEAAIDRLCTREVDGKRIRPKIIASTATVRRAEKQIHALFDRRSVEVFPPPGPDRRNSFFARQVPAGEAAPRLYLGVAAQGRSPKVLFLRTMVTLMAAAQRRWDELGGEKANANPADPYMTVIAYFNALRELGSARRIVEDEVRTRLASYSGRLRVGETPARFHDRSISYEPKELTSRIGTAEVSANKRALAQGFANAKERVDSALATNMISVGLDIVRLGLMVVSGQPKTTAEYIQATSRVGRRADLPGLVVTLLNVHKPRDRSHYERFCAYHASFYRGVEATSVTPFSRGSLDRALAAAVVGLGRLGNATLAPQTGAVEAATLRPQLDWIADYLAERGESAGDGIAKAKLRARVADLLDEWAKMAADFKSAGTSFGYRADQSVSKALLREVLDPELPSLPAAARKFRAPRSMRDVEPAVLLNLKTPDNHDVVGD